MNSNNSIRDLTSLESRSKTTDEGQWPRERAAEYFIWENVFTKQESTENISVLMYLLNYWWAFPLYIIAITNCSKPSGLTTFNYLDQICIVGRTPWRKSICAPCRICGGSWTRIEGRLQRQYWLLNLNASRTVIWGLPFSSHLAMGLSNENAWVSSHLLFWERKWKLSISMSWVWKLTQGHWTIFHRDYSDARKGNSDMSPLPPMPHLSMREVSKNYDHL